MIRPTHKTVGLLALGTGLALVIAIIAPAVAISALLFPLAIALFVLSDAQKLPPPHAVWPELTLPSFLYMGDRQSLSLRLRGLDRGRISQARLAIDLAGVLRPTADPYYRLGPERGQTLTVPLVPKGRGKAQVERIWLRLYSPMGLVYRQQIEHIGAEIPVGPNIGLVGQSSLAFHDRTLEVGLRPLRSQGEGSEFQSLREYVPGLDPRTMDWKRSARRGELVCKYFEVERNHSIILAIDTGHLMREEIAGAPKLDHAINSALQLAYRALKSGDKVGLFAFDSQVRDFVPPIGGTAGFDHIRRHLAMLEYSTNETNFTLGISELRTRLNRRSLIIMQTEFVDTITAELMRENLDWLARRHLVVFVTPRDHDLHGLARRRPDTIRQLSQSVIANQFLQERDEMMAGLRRLGVRCLEPRSSAMGEAMIREYLTIKQKDLL